MVMITVGIAEFKAKLSKYVERAQQGEEVVVTDRGRPVVTVNRVTDEPSEIDELVRKGIVSRVPDEVPDDFITGEGLVETDGPGLSEAVIEERREARY